MPNNYDIKPETITYIIKVIIPALAAVCIKIAVEMKFKRVSVLSAFLSLIIGILTAYLAGDVVLRATAHYSSIAIAVIAITSEKIAYWLIFKFNIDYILDAMSTAIGEKIKRFFK